MGLTARPTEGTKEKLELLRARLAHVLAKERPTPAEREVQRMLARLDGRRAAAALGPPSTAGAASLDADHPAGALPGRTRDPVMRPDSACRGGGHGLSPGVPERLPPPCRRGLSEVCRSPLQEGASAGFKVRHGED